MSCYIYKNKKYTQDELISAIKNEEEWKYEIDDNISVKTLNVDGKNLTDVISYPELIKAFPEIKNISFEVIPFDEIDFEANLNEATNTIELSSYLIDEDNIDLLKSKILHELQHKIQILEGWNPLTSKDIEQYKSNLRKVGLTSTYSDIEDNSVELLDEVLNNFSKYDNLLSFVQSTRHSDNMLKLLKYYLNKEWNIPENKIDKLSSFSINDKVRNIYEGDYSFDKKGLLDFITNDLDDIKSRNNIFSKKQAEDILKTADKDSMEYDDASAMLKIFNEYDNKIKAINDGDYKLIDSKNSLFLEVKDMMEQHYGANNLNRISSEKIINDLKDFYSEEEMDYFDAYWNAQSEVEARNVEKRINMTADERRNTLLSETEDVSREDQIFLFNAINNNAPTESIQKLKEETGIDLTADVYRQSNNESNEAYRKRLIDEIRNKLVSEYGAKQLESNQPLIQKIKNFFKDLYEWFQKQAGLQGRDVSNMTLQEFVDASYNSIMKGEWMENEQTPGISIQEAIKRNNGNSLNLAPNGEPSILYQSYIDLGYSDSEAERLTAQVFSDEFQNWVDGSKVVDENGQPLLIGKVSTNINYNYGSEYPTFFAKAEDIKNFKGEFGEVETYVFLNIRQPFVTDKVFEWSDVPVFELFSTQEALDIINMAQNFKGEDLLTLKNYESFLQEEGINISLDELSAYLKNNSSKYDGVIVKDVYEGVDRNFKTDDYITFNATQVKSATENIGTFSTENNDIRFQKQEEIKNNLKNFASDEKLNIFLNLLDRKRGLQKNPINPKEFIYSDAANLEFNRFDKGNRDEIALGNISVINKNSQNGSKIMKDITEVADELGYKITLEAKPFGNDKDRLDIKALVNFYKKAGFIVDMSAYGGDFTSEEEMIEYAEENPSEAIPMFRETKKVIEPISVKDLKMKKAPGDRGEFDGVYDIINNKKEIIGSIYFNSNDRTWRQEDYIQKNAYDIFGDYLGTNKTEALEEFVKMYNKNIGSFSTQSNDIRYQMQQEIPALRDVYSTAKAFTAEGGNKAVDEKGNPIKVFTGTNANSIEDIDALYFENDKILKDKLSDLAPNYQIFFTDNKKEAQSFGKNVFEANVVIKNPVKNKSDLLKTKSELIKEGYDGYIWESKDGRTHYIVFDKAQIKSESLLSKEQTPPALRDVENYNGIFSTKKTGIIGLDDLLEDDGYNYFYKGVSGEVVMMSPEEYLKKVREGLKTKEDANITKEKKDAINNAIDAGNKIYMPFISIKDGKFSQEGRNRAIVAKERGEKLIPVFIEKNVSYNDKIAKGKEYISLAIKNGAINKQDVLDKLKKQGLHRDAVRFIDDNLNDNEFQNLSLNNNSKLQELQQELQQKKSEPIFVNMEPLTEKEKFIEYAMQHPTALADIYIQNGWVEQVCKI